MLRRSSRISLVNTSRRHLVTKTKCTCIRKTQCRPCRISLSSLIGQAYHFAHATSASLQIRTDADLRAGAQHAPLRRVVPLRLQQSAGVAEGALDRKSTRLNSSHVRISYAVFCL